MIPARSEAGGRITSARRAASRGIPPGGSWSSRAGGNPWLTAWFSWPRATAATTACAGRGWRPTRPEVLYRYQRGLHRKKALHTIRFQGSGRLAMTAGWSLWARSSDSTFRFRGGSRPTRPGERRPARYSSARRWTEGCRAVTLFGKWKISTVSPSLRSPGDGRSTASTSAPPWVHARGELSAAQPGKPGIEVLSREFLEGDAELFAAPPGRKPPSGKGAPVGKVSKRWYP